MKQKCKNRDSVKQVIIVRERGRHTGNSTDEIKKLKMATFSGIQLKS
jgi:hypothetical protein